MWGLENAYRDRLTLLEKELKAEREELEAKLEALRRQIEASETSSLPRFS
jgi:hypothetical protein